MDEMAFVSAVPRLTSTHLKSSVTGRPLTTRDTSTTFVNTSPNSVNTLRMQQVEFQSYSGGLDRVSTMPYTITRYLFKPPPATLTDEEKDGVINTGLRHLFGNAYLMDEERAEFYVAESRFRCGEITAKEFARAVAKSDTYRQRFFESVSQFRFIELNFKHFLGRAPLDQVEYSKHFKIFAEGGYQAEIDSYFDDPEYDDVFGEDLMPFTRFRGTYAPINQFNRMCTLEGGFATSDKKMGMKLTVSLAANVPTPAYSIMDGLPPISNSEHPSKKYELPNASLERYRNELNIAKARASQLELEVQKAYKKFDSYRNGFDAFKSMAADMDFIALPGPRFTGPVENFPTWSGPGMAPKPWGVAGVDRLNGPVKRSAAEVSKKEKEFERIKALVVDIERRIAVLEAARESPAITPKPIPFVLEGLSVLPLEEGEDEKDEDDGSEVAFKEELGQKEKLSAQFDTSTILTDEIDLDDEDANFVKPKSVDVVKSRQRGDVPDDLPKDLIKELEEKTKAEGKAFGGPKNARLSYPGDGSEMTVG